MTIFADSFGGADEALAARVADARPDRVFVVADVNTASLVAQLPQLAAIADATITIAAGDAAKTVGALSSVWERLSGAGATRHSLVVNVGGGVVCDLGGFAAATFKRGVRCMNVPTTLLAMVDASAGGKTGVNLGNLKNEVGVFAEPCAVVTTADFLRTLPAQEVASGYAEMLKHAIIDSGEMLDELLDVDLPSFSGRADALGLIERNAAVKARIVGEDPTERGVRKKLNLGHTAGHAIETWHLNHGRGVAHGCAVAWGLVVEAVLARLLRRDADQGMMYRLAKFVGRHYGVPAFECGDYDELLELMRHDKKNLGDGSINFTLPVAPGHVTIDNVAAPADIMAAFDIARDLL